MPRYKITVEYDGGPFVGWQRQDNGPSVQACLEQAAEALCGAPVTLFGAGRTDAGVHALAQVAHFDLPKDFSADTVRDALNFHLKPQPIAVLAAGAAAPDFHARLDATERRYLYRLLPRRAPAALDRGRVWQVPYDLDAEVMHLAAQDLIGKHDFTTFRSAHCQAASPVKTLTRLSVMRAADEIHVHAAAPSFLHNQVRSLVGTLKLVGEGKWRPADVRAALAAQDRSACGPVAPPQGLYLEKVVY